MRKIFLLLLLLIPARAWAAFPTVAGTAATYIVSGTSWACALPSSVAAGDLLLLFIHADSNVNFFAAFPGSWVELWDNDATAIATGGAYLIASGGETSVTVSLSTGTADDAVCLTYRITGWHGTTPPQAGTPANYTGPGSPNPPSLTPSWGAADTLWIVVGGNGECETTGTMFTAAPTNYENLVQQNGISTNCSSSAQPSIGAATRNLNATSDDPGAFTIADTNPSGSANIVAVRPRALTPRPPVIVQ